MSSKPTHTAYIVIEAKGGSDRKPQWHEIGAIWPHTKGNGFDLVIPTGVSVTGRIVCIERKNLSHQPNRQAPSLDAAGLLLQTGATLAGSYRVIRSAPTVR